jgi:outer membrane protein OmpA-like peptidoglycan-associated protein
MIQIPLAVNKGMEVAAFAALVTLGFVAVPAAAAAQGPSFQLEPGLAIPLTSPQTDVYKVGGGQSVKLLFGLTPWLDIGPNASFLLLPAKEDHAESGIVWGFGGGLRVKRPHDASSFSGISPWFDADALYIRTGDLNRPGFDAAVGLAVPVGEARALWVGPFVRYLHVLQRERAGFDNGDAQILSLGVSFEVGQGVRRPSREPPAYIPEPIVKIVSVCGDRDNDGIADDLDRCPDVAGRKDLHGCPPYEKVVVQPDKIELKERIYFAWDEAKLEDASLPVLDEVVQAMKDNKGFRVKIQGHADSSGGDDHNQALSERRAQAVMDYLVAHGVAKDRLVSTGFSSSVPTSTNDTAGGREDNRRVQFVVQFILLNDGSAPQ